MATPNIPGLKTMTQRELKEARASLIEKMRDRIGKAQKDPDGNPSLAVEDKEAHDQMWAEVSLYGDEIKIRESNASLAKLDIPDSEIIIPTGTAYTRGKKTYAKYQSKEFGSRRERQWEPDQRLASKGYLDSFTDYMVNGNRNASRADGMQADLEPRGGYFVVPEQIVSGILKTVDDEVFIQRASRVIPLTTAQSLGVRKRITKSSTWGYGSELSDATDNMEDALTYGKRVLTPHYITGSNRISRELLRLAPQVESEVNSEIATELGEFLEQAYLFGDGQQKPLGLFTVDSEGIPATRDVSYGTTTTTFTFDTFQKAKYTLKQKYRRNAKYMLHRDVIAKIAMLKDSTNQYLWQPSRVVGEPDRINGVPVMESEWIPSTAGASLYFGILADFDYYWIVVGLDWDMQRLIEMRARTNQVEYVTRLKIDAMPMLDEAFVRLQYAAS